MGITFDDESIVSKDNVPYIIPRDANYDTMSVLGGFDATNTFKFAAFTPEGKLKVDASVSIEHVDIGDVNMQVKGPTGADLLVSGDFNVGTTQAFIFVQDSRMEFTGPAGGSLLVDVTGSDLPEGAATEATQLEILEALGGGNTIDKLSRFGSESVEYNSPTTILDYVVPVNNRFRIDSVRAWADVDAEYYVMIDGLQVDGYRTTPANLTMSIDSTSIQFATAGQHVVIGATHFRDNGSKTMKAVLQGALEIV